jgi:hypothetical protein
MIKTCTGASEAKKKEQDREAVSKKGKRSKTEQKEEQHKV